MKLQWRPQECRGAPNMQYLQVEAIDSGQNLPKRVAMWATQELGSSPTTTVCFGNWMWSFKI
jgi:hypothetical protein